MTVEFDRTYCLGGERDANENTECAKGGGRLEGNGFSRLSLCPPLDTFLPTYDNNPLSPRYFLKKNVSYAVNVMIEVDKCVDTSSERNEK